MTHVAGILNQESFRARNDNGSETTATWIALANANWSQDADATFRARFLVQETAGATNAETPTLNLYYQVNGGGYAVVSTTTPIQFTASGTVTDGTATTAQLGAGTFVAGEFDSDGTVAANAGLQNSETEMEYCLTIDSAQVAASDIIQLQVWDGGATLATYTNTPSITVVIPAGTDNLLADDAESATETSSPAIGQIHGLLADATESATETSSPNCNIVNILLANDTQSLSETSSPNLGVISNFLADDTESATETSSPPIGQIHGLLADDAESATETSSPVLSEVSAGAVLENSASARFVTQNPSLAITTPTAGNVLITFLVTSTASAIHTVPTGYTKLFNGLDTELEISVATKVADGTETSVQWFTDASREQSIAVLEYSNLGAITPNVPVTSSLAISGTSINAVTTNTTTISDCLSIAFANVDGAASAGTVRNFTNGYSIVLEQIAGGGSTIHLATKNLTTTQTTDTTFSHDGSSDQMHLGMLVIAVPTGTVEGLLADDAESASEVSSPALGQVHALLANDAESASEVSSPSLGEVTIDIVQRKRNNVGGGANTLTFDATCTLGNLLIATIATSDNSESPWSAPVGWTVANASAAGNQTSCALAYKISDGTETGITWTGSSTNSGEHLWFIEVANPPATSPNVSVITNDSAFAKVSSLSTGTSAVTTADTFAIALFVSDGVNFDTPTHSYTNGFHELDRHSATGGRLAAVAYKDNLSGNTVETTFSHNSSATVEEMASILLVWERNSGTVDNLLADDVESATETSSPAVGQIHGLLADDTESATETSSPAVGQLHGLLVDDTESATETSSPAVGQLHGLLADGVESATETSTPIIGQLHGLLADGVESATETSTPIIGQLHGLLADDTESATETSSPALTSGAESAELAVTFNPKAGWAVQEITGAVYITGSIFENSSNVLNTSQVYYPTANNTSIDATGLITTDNTSNFTVQFWDVNDGQWKQILVEVATPLLADDAESATETSSPAVGQIHGLLADDTESATETSTPIIGQLHGLLADDTESATETSTPIIGQLHGLISVDSESITEVTTPIIGQAHGLISVDTESATETSSPVLAEAAATITGNIAQSIGPISQSLSGTVTADTLSGDIAQSIGPISQSLSGTVTADTLSGDIAQSIGPISQSATGNVFSGIVGPIAQSIGPISQSLSGTVTGDTLSGDIAQSIGPISQSAIGIATAEISGNIAQSIGPISQALTGTTVDDIISASINQSIGPISQSATGTVTADTLSGDIAQSIGPISQLASGTTVADIISSTIAQSIGPISQLASGTVVDDIISSTITQSIGPISQSATGTVTGDTLSGNIAQSIGPISQVLIGNLPGYKTGPIVQSIGPISQSASGIVTADTLSGNIVQVIGPITQSGLLWTATPLPSIEPLTISFTEEYINIDINDETELAISVDDTDDLSLSLTSEDDIKLEVVLS